ncbi:MAG: preprotein translocase subunit SecY [Thermoplasmata archaeon]|nr:preprotein translocase subunit SecY [Thermoplasmata archaeon]MCI4359088.1 preprotein translocase subunit SecY [Thermoplasmata archaeon]
MAEEEIPRNYSWAIPLGIIGALLLGLDWLWGQPTPIAFGLTALVTAAVLGIFFLGLSYDGPKSKLYGLKPLTGRMPAVAQPKGHVQFRTKMFWTVGVLLMYFLLTNIYLYGVDQANVIDLFQSYRAILAGAQGTLMHLGIGPIVTGSIIMQLFTGAKIINLDLTDDEDKGMYQGTQKVMVVAMIFVEAIPQVFGYLSPSTALISGLGAASPGNGMLLADAIIVAQLVFGSYLVFLMDEVVSKWGIGSGISLFIAAGVSQQIVQGTLNWLPSQPGVVSAGNPPSGTIPKAYWFFTHYNASQMAGGGWEQVLLHSPNPVVALAGTALIFFLVAWTESTRIELPLSHAEARGARGRYPLRLIYASNIPVILMSALLANVSMFSILLWSNPALSHFPVLGHQWWVGKYALTAADAASKGVSQTTPLAGGAYYLSTVNGLESWLLPLLNAQTYGGFLVGHSWWEDLAHVLIYFSVMVIGSIIFARFWIQTTNMGPEAVARQIEASGMQIPGFRREPRVLRRVLERYIPVITIISGAAVGALAAGADLIGTVGNASGTGVLLTVGIIINLYEAMGREQLMEMNPLLRRFLGGE